MAKGGRQVIFKKKPTFGDYGLASPSDKRYDEVYPFGFPKIGTVLTIEHTEYHYSKYRTSGRWYDMVGISIAIPECCVVDYNINAMDKNKIKNII